MGCACCFRHTDRRRVMDHLPLQIGQANHIIIENTDLARHRSDRILDVLIECLPTSIDLYDQVIAEANAIHDVPVVIDFRTDWHEKVYPMVPAGSSNDDVILGPLFDREG